MRRWGVGVAAALCCLGTSLHPVHADDSDRNVRIGGFGQVDGRLYEPDHPAQSAFLIRRAHLDVTGKLPKDVRFRLSAAFATPRVAKAWLEWRRYRHARVRAGLFKVPFGLERRYAARWIRFVERGLGPSNAGPLFDVGIKLFGKVANFEYDLAVFNGSGRAADTNDSVDGVLRLGIRPVPALLLGASGSIGRADDDLSGTPLRSAARTSFFEFADGVAHSGLTTRGGAEVEYKDGRWLAYAEALCLRRDEVVDTLGGAASFEMVAGYAALSAMLTPHEQPQSNGVEPRTPVGADEPGWGAIEIHARVDVLRAGQDALDAGLATGASEAAMMAIGSRWYPSRNVQLVLDLMYASFGSGAPIDDELAAIARAQYVF